MAVLLQKLIENERENQDIPLEWLYRDLENFGLEWKLFPYQKKAINNTIVLLLLLFDNWKTNPDVLDENRQKVLDLYRRNGLASELECDLSIVEDEQENYEFLRQYYQQDNKIPFKSLINRAAFWMATGSGKTLVMIKLIAVLGNFIYKGLIPKKDILILAPKDNILNQIKEHINIFNKGTEITINLRSVKDYERVKNQSCIFSNDEINVFYYRADNIAGKDMVAKKKDGQRLDYESIYNSGNWYLILDEAHKGDKETAKRQQYYLALTHKGFLFNFSATFTEELDKVTTIFDYKLDTFLKDGYGKMLYVAGTEFRNFERNLGTDFSESEQKSIITQSLIMLAVAKQEYVRLQEINKKIYHSPLLITLANSVNTDDADLKLFYELLSEIARDKNFNFDVAKNSLIQRLGNNTNYLFNLGEIDPRLIPGINAITEAQFRNSVFNSPDPGNIQVIKLRDNTRELAFKLQNANKYFMLIHASDIVKWEDNVLEGYEFSVEIEDSFFKDLENRPNLNILLGSRIFSEGWDTNRPNIINFINIGVSADAQKYVLQSIGRGVRIEPLPGKRQRFGYLNVSELSDDECNKIAASNRILESLFVFATNKAVVQGILEGLEKQSAPAWTAIQGIKKSEKINERELPLFIPVFENETLNEKPFWIGTKELEEVQKFVQKTGIKVLLLKNMINNIHTYNKVLETKNFESGERRRKRTTENILFIADNYFNEPIKQLSEIKILEGEISHYKEARTNISKEEVELLEYELIKLLEPKVTDEELVGMLKDGKITLPEYTQIIRDSAIQGNYRFLGNILDYKILTEHYYSPILYKQDSDKFQHIIKKASEIDFIIKLIQYIDTEDNKLNECEWWYFSKIDESIDSIGIPYFNTERNQYDNFYPDFIFWIKKGDKYSIKFVDPHGVEHTTNSTDKIDGFNDFLRDYSKMNERKLYKIELFYFNENKPSDEVKDFYKNYWSNDFNEIFVV